MSKFGDKVLNTLGFEVVYDDTSDTEPQNEVETLAVPSSSKPVKSPVVPPPKVIAREEKESVKSQVVLFVPQRLGDAKKICDELKLNRTVVVNVEKLEHEEVVRLYDFVTGASYALDGTFKEINEQVLVLAPQNVEIRKTDNIREVSAAFEEEYDEEFDYDEEEFEY
jgi:cell division inhibitor SepF